MSTTPASLRALLSGLIDYAGLFPPASLDMKTAVQNYARYLAGPDAWALARFVLPVSRFAEFESAIAEIDPIEPWGITALLGTSPESGIAEIDRFNQRNARKARVDSVEVKASTLDDICHIRPLVRGSIMCYFEIPPASASELLSTIKAIHGRAKIRTGGVTPDAYPSCQTVASFIAECARQEVAFKATAGLHHPVRCVKPLSYEPNAPTNPMHGFLNVFVTAARAWANGRTFQCEEDFWIRGGTPMAAPFPFTVTAGNEDQYLANVLKRTSFKFRDDGIEEPLLMPTTVLKSSRQNFAISFGSCSFEEPLADLRELKFL